MRGIKIPQQDFALQGQGRLMCKGGVFAGHYGTSGRHFEWQKRRSGGVECSGCSSSSLVVIVKDENGKKLLCCWMYEQVLENV